MHLTDSFDSGNALVVEASDPGAIVLRLRPEPTTGAYQWFHFRVSGVRDQAVAVRIDGLDGASFPAAWPTTRAVASTDGLTWRRVPTEYADGSLRFTHTPRGDGVWFALFAPYPLARHHALIARAAASPGVALDTVATTLDGRSVDRLTLGSDASDAPVVWIIARQHAGETMAGWFMEGLVDRLIDDSDGLARGLRGRVRFCLVPNMNPDGSYRGHIRGNAMGTDLNRAWADPDPATAPEVHGVRAHMDRTGVGLCLDIHGDEERPYVFVNGPDGVPGFDAARAEQMARFRAQWATANPHFQYARGYRPAAPGKANMALCTNAVAERFGCLALTLEQPFTDVDSDPDPVHGWSPARARSLGASVLHPIAGWLAGLS